MGAGLDRRLRDGEVVLVGEGAHDRVERLEHRADGTPVAAVQDRRAGGVTSGEPVHARGRGRRAAAVQVGQDDRGSLTPGDQVVGGGRPLTAGAEDAVAVLGHRRSFLEVALWKLTRRPPCDARPNGRVRAGRAPGCGTGALVH